MGHGRQSDGTDNLTEILNGTSPIDSSSDGRFSVDTTGNSGIGSTVSVNVRQASGSDIWVTAYATGMLPAPIGIPGFVGTLHLDPATLVTITAGAGTTSTPVSVPATPSLAGACLFIQGAYLNVSTFHLGNLSGISVW